MATRPLTAPFRAGEPKSATRPHATARLDCVDWRALRHEVAAWDALAQEAAEPNPFLESWYLLPSLEHLARAGEVSILRFEQDGRLAGILPIARSPRYYRWPLPNLTNWQHANAFCGVPLVARGAAVPFWRALLDWADANAGTALFLHLRGLVVGGPLHVALDALLACEERTAAIVHQEARAMLCSDLGATPYYEASLSAKKRKELRRQAARLADEGVVAIERQTDASGLAEWTERFLALEAAGWKGEAGSALACDPATAALFRDSLRGAVARGRLERLALTLDGRPVAMLATFVTPPGAFSFKTAFDEAYARFSPGVLLQQANLAMLDRPDVCWSDSCAAADHPMIDHLWRERRGIARVSIAIGGRVRRAAFSTLVARETARLGARRQA